jgi:hypothetical protein
MRPIINTSLLLNVAIDDPYKVELVDNLIISSEIKSFVLTPYLNSLFTSLALSESKKIPRYIFNEVTQSFNLSTWHYLG